MYILCKAYEMYHMMQLHTACSKESLSYKEAEDFCENKLAPKIEEMATIGKKVWEEYCPIKIAVRVANYLRRHNFSVNARCFDNEQEIIEIKW